MAHGGSLPQVVTGSEGSGASRLFPLWSGDFQERPKQLQLRGG